MDRNYDCLILFSSGADSILLGEMAKEMKMKPFFLMIDYNQLHIEELDSATKYLQNNKNECGWTKVKLDIVINSALTGRGEKGLYKGVSEYHVPMRNSMFLTVACSYAEAMGIPKIWIGCDFSDAIHNFLDCEQEYIIGFNEFLKVASPANITVEAPLLGFSKEMVVKMLDAKGIDIEKEGYSGYKQWT
jgi:7-cyano-7-deazaguanine synthase